LNFKNYWVFLGLIAGLLFGIATPFSKLLLADLNSFQLSGLLYLGSGIVIIPSIIKNFNNFYKAKDVVKDENTSKKSFLEVKFDKNFIKILLIILFGGILGPLFLMIGLSHNSASSTAVWLNMELVATAILGLIFFKDNLDKFASIGLLLTFIAGLIVSWGNGFGDIFSIIFIILACFSWGLDNQLTSIVDGYSPEFITFVKGIFGGGVNLTIGMIIASQMISLNLIFYGIILGLVSYGLSIVFFVSSAQNLGATRSQILFATAPFWGIMFSIFIGEPLTFNLIIAIILLIVAVLITNNIVHNHKHYHNKVEHVHLHSHDDGHHVHKHDSNDFEIYNKDKDKNKKHTHTHVHNEKYHEHNHFPDLHHKHDH
jgi:drug/metabolite transporter (DMT)-like permease